MMKRFVLAAIVALSTGACAVDPMYMTTGSGEVSPDGARYVRVAVGVDKQYHRKVEALCLTDAPLVGSQVSRSAVASCIEPYENFIGHSARVDQGDAERVVPELYEVVSVSADGQARVRSWWPVNEGDVSARVYRVKAGSPVHAGEVVRWDRLELVKSASVFASQ